MKVQKSARDLSNQKGIWRIVIGISLWAGVLSMYRGYSALLMVLVGSALCLVLAIVSFIKTMKKELKQYWRRKPEEAKKSHLSLPVRDQLLRQRGKLEAEIGQHRFTTRRCLLLAAGFVLIFAPWRAPALILALALLISFALITTCYWLDMRRLQNMTARIEEMDADLQDMPEGASQNL